MSAEGQQHKEMMHRTGESEEVVRSRANERSFPEGPQRAVIAAVGERTNWITCKQGDCDSHKGQE